MKKITYLNEGGNLTFHTFDGKKRTVKKGARFTALEGEIPKSFLDTLKVLDFEESEEEDSSEKADEELEAKAEVEAKAKAEAKKKAETKAQFKRNK